MSISFLYFGEYMSKGSKVFLVVLGILVLLGVVGCNFISGNYNSMVSMEETVKSQWAQVENQYQRRLDLIPNLVSTVKGYASHESEVYEEVAKARSAAGGVVNIDKSVLDDP